MVYMNSNIAVKQLNAIKKIINSWDELPQLAGSGWSEKWQTLIAIILSAQTRDTTTIRVCNKLFKKYRTPLALSMASVKQIEKDISSVNYHKTKAQRIKETASIIAEDGIGNNLEELAELPGVGRKTANVYLAEVYGEAAIGVDVHVARISKKMGWTKNKYPDKIEEDLKKLFPKTQWNSVNSTLVSFGQTVGRSSEREDEELDKIRQITQYGNV